MRACGVFIFVRNFSRGIFLRKSLYKVVTAAAVIPSMFRIETPETRFFGIPKKSVPGVSMRNRDGVTAAAAATLGSGFLRKIPREKFRTKVNTPRARENVRRTEVVTLV